MYIYIYIYVYTYIYAYTYIYIPIYVLTRIYLTNVSSKQKEILPNHWLKGHVQTADNCQILYTKFHILFKIIQRKIARKFVSTLVLSLALENFTCDKPIQKYVYMLK